MRRLRKTTFGSIFLTALLLVMATAGPASAAPKKSTCRASAVRVQGKGLLSVVFLEPVVVANQAGKPCSAMSQELTDLVVPLALGSIQIARATTTVVGTGNHPTSTAEVSNISISLPGLPVIGATVLTSTASAGGCMGGPSPTLSSSSQVVGLTVGGAPLVVGSAPFTLPLGPFGALYLNRTITGPTSITQRALELDTVLASVVLAEVQAGYAGNPCV